MYDNRLQFKPRAPEPGTKAASGTLVEVKILGADLGRVAQMADRLAGPVRGSNYNRGWRWHLQLWAGVGAIAEGAFVIWAAVTLLGRL